MSIINIEPGEMFEITNGLAQFVNFEKDLPSNIFIKKGFSFWFFERPLIDYSCLFSGLVSISFSAFGSGPFIKFCGSKNVANSCIKFDGVNIEDDADLVRRRFTDFFGGTVGYPIFLFNKTHDWIACESAHDEFGVIAVNSGKAPKEFIEYLDLNFISRAEMTKLAGGASVESITAQAFLESYF